MTKSVTKIQDKDTTRRLSVVRSTEDPTKYGVVILNPDGSRIRWPKGEAATVNVGTTTTSNPWTSASVENVGTENDAILDFTIPRGSIVSAGTTSTWNPWSSANVTESVVDGDVILNFTIPRGSVVSVWSTTTWGAGTSASVVNTGTGGDVVLDFTIPRWDKGDTGNGISSVTSSKSWKTTTVTINFTDGSTPFTFQVSDGDGDVNWPISAWDGNIVLYDWTTGKLIKDSWLKVGDIKWKWIDVNVATAAWTAAKVWTTTEWGYTPTKWDFLLVNFVNGCGVDNPTLNIDWSGAKNIRTGSANANKSTFALWTTANSNIKALLYYDWTYYRCWSTTNANTTYSAMSVAEWKTGTATSSRAMRADYLKQIIKYHAVSDTEYGSSWDWKTDIAPSQNAVYDKINSIDAVMSSAATSSNPLVDKNYVDDSINSVTAYYITKNAQGDQWSTRAELFAATTFYSGWVVRTPTKNDYTIVLSDEQHDNATTRYIYNNWWEYQYTVNETALTQAQLNALNSWITSAKVSQYDGYASGKQDALTLPSTPTSWHLVIWGANNKTLVDGWVVPTVPTNVSSFNNDAGYLTSSTWVTSVNGSNWAVNVNDIKASSSAPSNPMEWMVWYDTTNDVVKVYDGSSWNEVGGWGWATYNAWPWIEIWTYNDYSAMRWPCPEGFHVPTKTEMQSLIDIWVSLSAWSTGNTNMSIYLKLPPTWYRSWNSSSGAVSSITTWYYQTCTKATSSNNYYLTFYSTTSIAHSGKTSANAIRPFKDRPVVPDSNWTTIYSWTWDAWIFHNAILWLISISSDWINWITIADKNLGATVVWNNGDETSQSNKWWFYQWWNNYMFPATWSITTSSTKVDANNYWPWNYYSSSTFIYGWGDWSSVTNNNLRWGETWVVILNNAIINKGVLSVNGKGWDVLVQAQHSSLTATLTSAWWSSSGQTVSVSGVTAGNTVIVSPSPSSMSEYANAKVFCSAQGSNSLTFSCTDTPTSDIVVNVVILD